MTILYGLYIFLEYGQAWYRLNGCLNKQHMQGKHGQGKNKHYFGKGS